jgi:hypothetical protein
VLPTWAPVALGNYEILLIPDHGAHLSDGSLALKKDTPQQFGHRKNQIITVKSAMVH